jgi:integrase
MAIYRRGRIWYADFYVQGRRVQESAGTANRREAEKFYGLRLSEVQCGTYVRPAKVMLTEFGEQYMSFAKVNKRSWLRDEQILVHVNEFFGDALLRNIGPLQVEQYKQARIAKVSPATVNREVALLKHMFNLAERWGSFHGTNPVRMVKFFDEDNDVYRVLSPEEEERLLQHCAPYIQDLIVFAINTGLRAGDIFNLTWEEVDLEGNVINPKIRKNRKQLEVPLNDAAERIVRAWYGIKKCRYVFYNPETGDRFKDLWLGLKKACRKAGLEGVNWHTFRHSFATRLNKNGADIVTVKELLGHSDVKVTMRYAHTNRAAKASAVRSLASPVVTK